MAASRVACGFPSPADDYAERAVDLHRLLVRNDPATFLLRAEGASMRGAGIHEGDLLVVDRSVEAADGAVVVAVLDGGLTVKRLRIEHGRRSLEADAATGRARLSGGEAHVWGVVRYVIHVPS